MKPILVIGATGNVGRHVVSQLAARDVRVRALTRRPDTARFSPQVEVVLGDLTEPSSLDRPLEGVDAVFLAWNAPAASAGPASERIARWADRVVYLSAPHQTPHPFFQQPNPGARLHAENERLIQASRMRWVFLRPGMFALNTIRWWAQAIRAGDVVRWPYAQAPTAPIHECDLAEVAVTMLCDESRESEDYVLTGPQSLTQSEQLETIGQAIGRSLHLEEITPEKAREELLAVMPLPVINMLMNAWTAALGQPAFITSKVAELLGRPAATFREWAGDRAVDFR